MTHIELASGFQFSRLSNWIASVSSDVAVCGSSCQIHWWADVQIYEWGMCRHTSESANECVEQLVSIRQQSPNTSNESPSARCGMERRAGARFLESDY